jgi:hypothetical protein
VAVVAVSSNGFNGRSIETSYAGHKMRSRLEARWAVFMDGGKLDPPHAPVWPPWRYEVEGVMLPGRGPYLPDFELGDRFSVEVKGADANLDPERCELFVKATGRHLLILGDVPRPDDEGLHLMWACVWTGHGALWQLWRWFYASDHGVIIPQGFDWPHTRPALAGDVSHAVAGVRRLDLDEQPEVDKAYAAARSARFEFGQTPKRTT